jgi:hypothetical protein
LTKFGAKVPATTGFGGSAGRRIALLNGPAANQGSLHQLPAYCEHCKRVIPSGIALGSGARGLAFGNSTICPKCGSSARVIDGSYETFGDRLNVVLSPSVSPEAQRALAALIEQVQKNKITLEQAEAQAAKIDPGFKRFFDGIADWSDQARATLLLTAATLLLAAAQVFRSSTFNHGSG